MVAEKNNCKKQLLSTTALCGRITPTNTNAAQSSGSLHQRLPPPASLCLPSSLPVVMTQYGPPCAVHVADCGWSGAREHKRVSADVREGGAEGRRRSIRAGACDTDRKGRQGKGEVFRRGGVWKAAQKGDDAVHASGCATVIWWSSQGRGTAFGNGGHLRQGWDGDQAQ